MIIIVEEFVNIFHIKDFDNFSDSREYQTVQIMFL